jgi:hypothetical protein
LLECTIKIGCVLWPWAVVCSWSEVGRGWVEIAAFMCRRQDQHVRSMCISRAELSTFFRSFPAASYLSFFRSEWGFRIWVEICSSHVLSRRAARSLHVPKRGATIDFFFEHCPGADALKPFGPGWGCRMCVEICSSHVSSRRATRSLYVDRQGRAIDLFQKLSCCQLSELFQLRVGVSYLGGDLQFSCVVETSSTFTSCIWTWGHYRLFSSTVLLPMP